jgi:putative salt-induced outer membrane protein YdiY
VHKIKFLIVLAALVCCSGFLFGDQVTLKNGDRLSGTVVKSDDKTLVIKTEFEGDVTVQWPAVQVINSSEPLHVYLNNGQTLVGPVTTADGSLGVATAANGTVSAPLASVKVIRSGAEEAAYEKSLHPGLSEGWAGGLNLGFALTGGNSQTKNLAVAFNANRTTLNDKFILYANTVYATNDAPGAVPSTTANSAQGGLRYDHNLTKKLFAFGNIDFQADALQDLNLRSIVGGGLGFHAIKNDHTTLDFLGGVNYTRENYSTFTRNFAAGQVGEEYTRKLGASTVLIERFYFFPDLTDWGQYRGTFDFGTVVKINRWLGWQTSFGDIYVTNPPEGKKQNDVVFTTGLNLSFTH